MKSLSSLAISIFLSTPSARRATTGTSDTETHGHISIHALREEGDLTVSIRLLTHWISIHALREEGDPAISCIPSQFDVFLSTPSARRATCLSCRTNFRFTYFYPRPPRGGRL